MNLNISGNDHGEPTPELISKAVHDENFRSEFFRIDKSEGVFLQVTGPNDQLIVEYRSGEENDMYSAATPPTCDELQALCARFVADDSDWNRGHVWEPMGFI